MLFDPLSAGIRGARGPRRSRKTRRRYGIGQRLTASGTTRFTDVVVHDDEFDSDGTTRPPVSPLFQIVPAAVAGVSPAMPSPAH